MNKKYNIEDIKEEFKKIGYILLTKNYKNTKSKLEYLCNKKHKNFISLELFKRGVRCSKCYGNKKLTFDYVKYEFEKIGYKLISKKYINAITKLEYLCDKGHSGFITWGSFSSGRRCQKCYFNSIKDKNHPNWRGGVVKLNLPVYDTYAPQLEWIEDVRRDPENENLLQVKCYESNCNKWFTPTRIQVHSRINSLNGKLRGENRFYCSNECKNNCSIFGQVTNFKNFKPDYSRELQPELRDLVLQRDEYKCQRCGNTSDLQCHHFEGLNVNPIESADIDNCITLCSECHKMAHENEGCRYVDMRKDQICNNL